MTLPTPPFAWRCPFCGRDTTVVSDRYSRNFNTFTHGNKYGTQLVVWVASVCPNDECSEYALEVMVFDFIQNQETSLLNREPRHRWQLIPAAQMRVLPAYVPEAIVADYREACLIATLSPKASATLARRCMQGMIRDFWKVKKKNLFQEIEALNDKVDPSAWRAMTAVRKIGNIGAHMEKDVNVIVDVEPDEARLLISLIETLIDEWYVARYEREQRFGKLAAVADAKASERQPVAKTT